MSNWELLSFSDTQARLDSVAISVYGNWLLMVARLAASMNDSSLVFERIPHTLTITTLDQFELMQRADAENVENEAKNQMRWVEDARSRHSSHAGDISGDFSQFLVTFRHSSPFLINDNLAPLIEWFNLNQYRATSRSG